MIEINGGISPISAVPGQHLSVKAKVTGHPIPDVTWTFNDDVLPPDVKPTVDGDKHKIEIDQVKAKHAGTYTIKATNDVGQDQKQIQLTLHGKIFCFTLPFIYFIFSY